MAVVVVGCSSTPTKESVVGVYEAKMIAGPNAGKSVRLDLQKNGVVRAGGDGWWLEGGEPRWKLQGRNVHIEYAEGTESVAVTYRVEPNGGLRLVSIFHNTEEKEIPKNRLALIFKKIQSTTKGGRVWQTGLRPQFLPEPPLKEK